ncbi:MAG: TRAP transporter substrate-binding protein [Proteobacteria bacterium]|nr:TRAP transporter substrate-binding protein [Pseudomonadota bacterium]
MHWVRTLVLTAGTALWVSSAAQAAKFEWTGATGIPESNFLNEIIQQFVKSAEDASGGKFKVTLHTNSTLIKRANIPRAVQLGQVQMGDVDMPGLTNEDIMFSLDYLPGVAPASKEQELLWKFQKPYMEKYFADRGMMLVFVAYWPGQGFFTKAPAKTPEDFKGQKMRISNAATQKMGNMLGFNSIVLPFAEVPQAFSTGMISAMYTSAQTGVDTQVWDHVKHYYYVGDGTKMGFVVNRAAFDKLDKDVQDALLKAAEKAYAISYKMKDEADIGMRNLLRQKGMIVEDAPSVILNAYHAVGRQMVEEWRKQASPEAIKILDAYQAALKK